MTKKTENSKPALFTWWRAGRKTGPEGTRVINEAQEDPQWAIASWRHPIPHANGVGSWEHTTYLVYYGSALVHREETTLINAKRWVEAHRGGGAHDGTQA